MSSSRVIELVEYEVKYLDSSELSPELGEKLWRLYSTQIDVDFPSPKVGNRWLLRPQGWVGYIPLTSDFGISLKPKVRLGTLFEMLEVAYRLKSFRFLEGIFDCASISAYYDRLARVLARRVLDRGRRGYFRRYVQQTNSQSFICGKIDIASMSRTPWHVRIPCEYQEHTGDIVDNQILTWTLSRISKSSVCTSDTLRLVRKADRDLSGIAATVPVEPADCVGRLYDRLNDDYEPLHALCRFFLEQAGPTHALGDQRMLPFLVDMARLFELFVSEWLRLHLLSDWQLHSQEKVFVDKNSYVSFCIDLVLTKAATGQAVCVLDTKYKAPSHPASEDVQQIIAYAVSKGCSEAILIYPRQLRQPLDDWVGGIHVRSMAFPLDTDLDTAGHELLQEIGAT